MLPLASVPAAVQAVRRSSDTAGVSSSTTVVTAGLGWSIGSLETWTATYSLYVTSSTTGGVRLNVSLPSGATGTYRIEAMSGVGSPSGSSLTIAAAAIGSDVSIDSGAFGTDHVLIVTVTVTCSTTAGTVDLTYAQRASDGTATKIKSGSSVVATRI